MPSSGHAWSLGQTDLTKASHPGKWRLKSGFGGPSEHMIDPAGKELL